MENLFENDFVDASEEEMSKLEADIARDKSSLARLSENLDDFLYME